MTNLSTTQNVFSISDAKIARVTVNTPAAYTVGSLMDLPELSSLDVTIKKEEKQATYGAGKIADSFTIITGLEVKFESVNIPLDVISAINGSTVNATANATRIEDKSTQVPGLFALAFKTDYVNGEVADFHETIHCVKGILDVISKADDYWTCSFEGTAVERKVDKSLRIIDGHKAVTPISITSTSASS